MARGKYPNLEEERKFGKLKQYQSSKNSTVPHRHI